MNRGTRALISARRFVTSVLGQRDKAASVLFMQDSLSFARSNLLLAACQLGLIEALRGGPATAAELSQRLGVVDETTFGLVLRLGVALNELDLTSGRYRLKGRRIRALAGDRGRIHLALLEEMVAYHGSVYRHLPERLRSGEKGHYLERFADTVARSSRVSEPFVAGYVREVVGSSAPDARVLDAGCGSGVYLRAASQVGDRVSGLGVDLAADAVAQARRNLDEWGIAHRFTAAHGDLREGLPDVGRFEIILLINNVYYFTHEQRVEVFHTLRDLMRPGGTLAVVSLFAGDSALTLNLDLVLASTAGCHALPAVETVMAEMREAGFAVAEPDRLVPGQSFLGVRGRAPSATTEHPTTEHPEGEARQ